jgi:hypothetical protein
MSGRSIASEVAAALREVATDVGTGEFLITLKQPSVTPNNPWDFGAGENGSSAYPFDDYELPAIVSDFPQSMIDGTLIQVGDRRVMLAATGPKPSTADKLEIQGVVHRIISVRETGPSGIPLYYFAQARI